MRSVGENDIVFRETFFGCGRGSHEEDITRAEFEEKYGTVFGGDFGERSMKGFLEEVEMAYYW